LEKRRRLVYDWLGLWALRFDDLGDKRVVFEAALPDVLEKFLIPLN
jgi:hypothetical protein